MHLETLLEIEKDTLAKYKATGRNDLMAKMLLRRIEQEIDHLERRIKNDKRKNGPTCESPRGFVHYVKGIIGSTWYNCNIYYSAVSRVLTSTDSAKKEGAK